MDPNKDTLRVLVATDSHLGYMEKDELRRDDSFNSFDEVCAIAAEKEVDFLLLGGDLFHENKPSRTTLIRTIQILRRYCLNDRPVQFQVVSDQTINFPNRYGHVNYEDPHFNIGLPVFSIHGNHDDPAGVDNLSAIDILSSCNLINYFGKVDLGAAAGVGQVVLHPILLQKGSTKVALYGLGNIRDERLNRMFQIPHAVQWIRPADDEECRTSDWFNIFVIHQNRVKSNPKNAINERYLAQFLDLVIWGHEHECLVDPQEVPGMDFHITQPGSSVATSLSEGEAAPKHVLLIEIKGNQYRPTKIPLKSVRPFLFQDVCLKDDPKVDPNDQDSVVNFLTGKVEAMIAEAPTKEASGEAHQVPLIRLRVDYTGCSTINPQRFGQKFVGKVANPNDILLFTKAAKARRVKDEFGGEEEEALGLAELNQQNIEALVAESHLQMEVLPVDDLGIALHDFVNKDEKQAFHVCLHENLDKTQEKVGEDGAAAVKEEKDVAERVNLYMRQREAEGLARRAAGKAPEAAGKAPEAASHSNQDKAPQPLRGIAAGGRSLDDFSDDEDLTAGSRPSPATGRRRAAAGVGVTGRGRGRGARGGGRYKQTTLNLVASEASQPPRASSSAGRASRSASKSALTISLTDEESPSSGDDPDVVLDSLDSDSEPSEVRGRGKKRGARGRGRAAQPAAKRGRRSTATVASYIEDDIEDDDDDDDAPVPSLGRGSTTSQGGGRKWGALRR